MRVSRVRDAALASHPTTCPQELSVPTYRDLFILSEAQLLAAGVWFGHGYLDAHDEAVELVLAAAGLPATADAGILDTDFPETQLPQVHEWLRRRCEQREPLAYLTGRCRLGPLSFRCDRRALVPRSPIAEVVLDRCQPWLPANKRVWRVVDVCCGGGSLGLLAAQVFDEAAVVLLDIDRDALALARENRDLHRLGDRVQLVAADLLAPLAPGSVDILLANPPYVDATDMAELPAEYRHEPRHALAAGEDGLALVHRLLLQARRALRPGGLLFLEVGNSWTHLEAAYPRYPFVWLELENGGHGVCVLSAEALDQLVGAPGV